MPVLAGIAAGIGSALAGIGAAVGSAAGAVGGAIGGAVGSIGGAVGSAAGSAASAVGSAASSVGGAVGSGFTGLMEAVGGGAGAAAGETAGVAAGAVGETAAATGPAATTGLIGAAGGGPPPAAPPSVPMGGQPVPSTSGVGGGSNLMSSVNQGGLDPKFTFDSGVPSGLGPRGTPSGPTQIANTPVNMPSQAPPDILGGTQLSSAQMTAPTLGEATAGMPPGATSPTQAVPGSNAPMSFMDKLRGNKWAKAAQQGFANLGGGEEGDDSGRTEVPEQTFPAAIPGRAAPHNPYQSGMSQQHQDYAKGLLNDYLAGGHGFYG